MLQKINRSKELRERESVDNPDYLDNGKDLEIIKSLNEQMKEVRRQYILKDKKSRISASNIVLTT